MAENQKLIDSYMDFLKNGKTERECCEQIVRMAEFAWSRLEPVEGKYTFDWLEKMLKDAGYNPKIFYQGDRDNDLIYDVTLTWEWDKE